jgi:hypothetical protein
LGGLVARGRGLPERRQHPGRVVETVDTADLKSSQPPVHVGSTHRKPPPDLLIYRQIRLIGHMSMCEQRLPQILEQATIGPTEGAAEAVQRIAAPMVLLLPQEAAA